MKTKDEIQIAIDCLSQHNVLIVDGVIKDNTVNITSTQQFLYACEQIEALKWVLSED